MREAYVVAVDGLSALRGVEAIPQNIRTAALRAVNRAAERGRASAKRRMLEQIDFGARYLDSENRFVLDKAKTADDAATITGRHRPTSLARFVRSGSPDRRRAGVSLRVGTGLARRGRRMFLIRLRQGNELTETKNNLGLAIRLKPGERIENKRQMVQLSGNLYLLYGPSVDQVFASVAEEEAPRIAEILETEFLRQLELAS